MFDKNKFITKGVMDSIPDFMQNLLWYMIQIMDVQSKDHLQVFHLSTTFIDGKLKQKITHKQEQPSYLAENIITVANPITAKIFVIDDGEISTMLLAEEY